MDFWEYLRRYGIKNPWDPRQNYDYYGAYKAGVTPTRASDIPANDRLEDIVQGILGYRTKVPKDAYMWPDKFKQGTHEVPARILDKIMFGGM